MESSVVESTSSRKRSRSEEEDDDDVANDEQQTIITTAKKTAVKSSTIPTTASTSLSNLNSTNNNHQGLHSTADNTAIITTTITTINNNNNNNNHNNADNKNTPISTKTTQQRIRDQTSLRYISNRVSKKVEEKKTTNYNEVANELVAEASLLFNELEKQDEQQGHGAAAAGGGGGGGGGDKSTKERRNHEKNIRRRVYDALNVLLATDIITKTKAKDNNREKVIHWKGFPTTRSDVILLEKEKQEALDEVNAKKRCLEELLIQNVCFSNLDRRNSKNDGSSVGGQGKGSTCKDERGEEKVNESTTTVASTSKSANETGATTNGGEKIALPFIVVNTSEKAVIQCEMNREKTDVMFDFNMPFEINDDNEILKRLGMDKTTLNELKKMLPSDIYRYCNENHLFDKVLQPPATSGTNASSSSSKISLPPRGQPYLPTKNDEYAHQQKNHHHHYPQHHSHHPYHHQEQQEHYPPPPSLPPSGPHGYSHHHSLPPQAGLPHGYSHHHSLPLRGHHNHPGAPAPPGSHDHYSQHGLPPHSHQYPHSHSSYQYSHGLPPPPPPPSSSSSSSHHMHSQYHPPAPP